MTLFLNFLNKFNKSKFIIFFFLGIINSFIEIIGISLLLPIFDILINNQLNENFEKFTSFLSISYDKENYLLILIIVIAIIYFLKLIISLVIVYFNQVIIEDLKISIQEKVIKNYFKRSLMSHNDDSIAVQIRMIAHESNSALYVINNLLNVFIELLLLFFILAFLFLNFFKITLVTVIIFSVIFLLYYIIFDKKIKEIGSKRVANENLFYQKIYSALSIFREIKFLKKENFFINKIIKIILNLRKISIQDTLLNGLIRPATEFFLILIILGALLYSKYNLNLPNEEIITSIGVFLAALIRCFPSITKLFLSYQKIVFRKKSVQIISEYLNKIEKKSKETKVLNIDENFNLNKNINFNKIYFSYKDRSSLLENINLEIKKGDFIGFLGKNGSGKSTLLDILTGITKPNSGEILVDNKNIDKNLDNWQNKIIYLSQKNYLFEETIISNIVLGENKEDIDKERLETALNISNFSKIINELPEGLDTQIGGNNFKISGGQQKKIQIARCFYQVKENKKLIILDEPTENLDAESKIHFLNSLKKYKQDKTIIIISHSLKDLDNCNKVFDLENKTLNNI